MDCMVGGTQGSIIGNTGCLGSLFDGFGLEKPFRPVAYISVL